VGFRLAGPELIDLPPYHYGMVMSRPQAETETMEIVDPLAVGSRQTL